MMQKTIRQSSLSRFVYRRRIMYTDAGVNSTVVYDAENHQAVFSVQVCI